MIEKFAVYYITQETDELCFTVFDLKEEVKIDGQIGLFDYTEQPNGGTVFFVTVNNPRKIGEYSDPNDTPLTEAIFVPATSGSSVSKSLEEWLKFSLKVDVVERV